MGLAIGAAAGLVALVVSHQTLFVTAESKLYDERMQWAARSGAPRADIALVEINEASLRDLEPVLGRWPWPRVTHAALIDFIAQGRPKVIAYDLLLGEPDTRLSFQYGEHVMSGDDSDGALGRAIQDAGNVILLADATYEGVTGTLAQEPRPFPDPGYPRSDLAEPRELITPPLADVAIVPQMKLVDRRCEDWENGWVLPEVKERRKGMMQIRLQGDFPRDCLAETAINVIDRVAFAERLFRTLWRGLGGRWSGRAREGDTPAGSRLLAEHRSRALADITRDINKRSDNPIARVVFLTLGALSTSPADAPTARRADAAIRQWLEARGIGHRGLVLENGSGLSRLERIAPAQLASVLQAGLKSPWAPEFLASLPIVAMDGGMRNRLRESPAAACARIKTGTLRDVTAVAGYVTDDTRETYVVVAMVNHPLAKRQIARPIVDALIDWVARPRDSPPPGAGAPAPGGARIAQQPGVVGGLAGGGVEPDEADGVTELRVGAGELLDELGGAVARGVVEKEELAGDALRVGGRDRLQTGAQVLAAVRVDHAVGEFELHSGTIVAHAGSARLAARPLRLDSAVRPAARGGPRARRRGGRAADQPLRLRTRAAGRGLRRP